MNSEKYVKVAVKGVSFHFDTEYSYLLPEKYTRSVLIGTRVEVPFGRGNRRTPALVLYIGDISELSDGMELKSIAAVLDEAPLFNDEAIQIIKRLKDTTFCTYYDAVKCVLPAGTDLKPVFSYTVIANEADVDFSALSPSACEVFRYLSGKGKYVKLEKILKDLGLDSSSNVLDELVKKGLAAQNLQSVRKTGDLKILFAELAEDEEALFARKLTVKQRSVLQLLLEIGSASVREICSFTGVSSAVVTALSKKGCIRIFEREVLRRPKTVLLPQEPEGARLNAQQKKAYSALKSLYDLEKASAALLYGITGSGKTQVYLKLIEDAVNDGKGIIVMVPEISLTPQALSIFHSRFPDKVAVFHSGLSAGERIDEWKRVNNGQAVIALGTRSAVFAPVKNLGIIVIDEEQEHTYKSEMQPKYHARDVAKFRCAYNNALLLFCSATPSVETYKKALDGKITLVTLKQRYGNSVLPKVLTVDTSQTIGSLSNQLYDELENCLSNKKQAILLINRRGFNTFACCTLCKKIAVCPNCSISLTYHRADNKLMCHCCGYSKAYTTTCEYCKNESINYYGTGTQKIEEEISRVFPTSRILRMDADTTGSRYSYEDKLGDFSCGKYDILIGTQMVAKGLDFPDVTLVGVISVDRELYNDDFRSAERTFDLLTQVIGRSGRRSTQGKAVIQSVNPDNEIISLAAKQDFEAFYKTEIVLRKAMLYPPFCDICTILFISESEAAAHKSAKRFFDMIVSAVKGDFCDVAVKLMGPIKPRIDKINNKHRYKLTVKCKNNIRFRQMMSLLIIEYNKKQNKPAVSISVDINAFE
ncbi:MAG: Primosomal protein N' [Firmicutes bacterium ADurb.Bin300]|nr:MAG: Primosomal protein N' [Firmicutes bacterium ADurb.Bin300]